MSCATPSRGVSNVLDIEGRGVGPRHERVDLTLLPHSDGSCYEIIADPETAEFGGTQVTRSGDRYFVVTLLTAPDDRLGVVPAGDDDFVQIGRLIKRRAEGDVDVIDCLDPEVEPAYVDLTRQVTVVVLRVRRRGGPAFTFFKTSTIW